MLCFSTQWLQRGEFESTGPPSTGVCRDTPKHGYRLKLFHAWEVHLLCQSICCMVKMQCFWFPQSQGEFPKISFRRKESYKERSWGHMSILHFLFLFLSFPMCPFHMILNCEVMFWCENYNLNPDLCFMMRVEIQQKYCYYLVLIQHVL